MKYYEIESNIPIPPRYTHSPHREAIERCKHGESFVVASLFEARSVSIAAQRMGRIATFRQIRPGEPARRVWILDPK